MDQSGPSRLPYPAYYQFDSNSTTGTNNPNPIPPMTSPFQPFPMAMPMTMSMYLPPPMYGHFPGESTLMLRRS